MGHAILERALLVGTRSADHIRASGHSGCIATGRASTRKNRPHTWLHPNDSQIGQIPLAPRAPSIHGVRREKAALSSGCKSHPATAPAGSNRSSYGGNEVAEAFGKRVTKYGDSASV